MAAVALERLIEPASAARYPFKPPRYRLPEPEPPPQRQLYYTSPALYSVPEPTPAPAPVPVPDSFSSSPSSVPASPYVFRRRGRPATLFAEGRGRLRGDEIPANGGVEAAPKEEGPLIGEGGDIERHSLREEVGEAVDDCDRDFWDPQETRSVGSCCSRGSAGLGSQTPLLNQSEFYDAAEEFLSDGFSQSSPLINKPTEAELHALRLNLLEERTKWKISEESRLLMQNQWQKMVESLAQLGLSISVNQCAGDVLLEEDPAEVCQEVVVLKFVHEAIERSLAQDETEAIAEEVILSKNHEISRLRDRLQYYEAVNREMSLRNQEELARQRDHRRKIRRRWIWSGVALSVTIGASFVAHYYCSLPRAAADSSSTDASSGSAD